MNPLVQAIGLVIIQLVMLLGALPVYHRADPKGEGSPPMPQGASVLQPYADLAKLFRKQPVISSTTSWIFTATPYIRIRFYAGRRAIGADLCLPKSVQLCR